MILNNLDRLDFIKFKFDCLKMSKSKSNREFVIILFTLVYYFILNDLCKLIC